MSVPDRDVAHLAASVLASMNQHINQNTTTSYKDMELLNPQRLDINKFIPQRRQNQGHQNPYQQNPYQQQPMMRPQMPQQQMMPPQQQYPMPVPAPQQGGHFEPVPLPNKPMGLVPMKEEYKKYLNSEDYEFGESNSSEFSPVDISGPSFQDTTFAKVEDEKPKTKVLAQGDDDVLSLLKEQKKEIEALKKKVGTLSTRLYKVLKFIEEQNTDSDE